MLVLKVAGNAGSKCHELNQSRYESRMRCDNLCNWQFYIQESKAKERREEKEKHWFAERFI